MLAAPPYEPPVPPRAQRCTAPLCGRPAAHRHHAVARSTQRAVLGKVYNWLLLNGELVLILVDLCAEHHDLLESGYGGCKSRLRWAGGWMWYDRARPEDQGIKIWWFDDNTETYWIAKGFCDGTYTPRSES